MAFQAQGRLLRPTFSADSRYVFFNIEPNMADILKARRDKKRPEDFPKTALGIMAVATGKVTRVEDVKSYQVPDDGSGFVADAAQSIEIRCRPVEARDEQIVERARASFRKAINRPASGMRWIASENR